MVARFLICIAVLAYSASTAAEIKIIGPATVPVGGMAMYRLEGTKLGDPFDFFATPTAAQLVVLFDVSGTPVGVLNGEKSGELTLVGVGFDAESKKITRSLLTVTIGKPKPDDPDPPGPPDPKPVPEGFLGLTKTVYMASGKLPAPLKKFLPELADSFESHGSAIAAGKGLEGALAELTTKNRQILAGLSADDRSTVTNVVFKEIEAVMDAAAKNGKLSKPEQYSEALIDVAAGLRLAK